MDDYDGGYDGYDGNDDKESNNTENSDEVTIGSTENNDVALESSSTENNDVVLESSKTEGDDVKLESGKPEDNDVKLEYDKEGTRTLSDSERRELQEKLGWSDKKMDTKCRIDENGTIHYKTDRHDLEGQVNEVGVKYERKTIEYNGEKIEGVFPVFDSKYDAQLDAEDYNRSSPTQERKCNAQLAQAVETDSELAGKFSEKELAQIKNGETPDGYTWHHNEEPGKMQLVERSKHDKTNGGTPHTGGNSIWGNKSRESSNNHKNKGVSF